MEGQLSGGLVEVGANARERYYDSRGYGRPRGNGVVLSPVEAAHLLYRGDLDSIDGRDFASFLTANDDVLVPFLVYKELRDRGFYLSPAREGWVDDPGGADFVVHPRGSGPWDGETEHRIRIAGERSSVPASSLGDVVLAVVDEESEITYLETDETTVTGSTELPFEGTVDGQLLGDRVLCWDPPKALYERGFYGQPIDDGGALQLSLLEAAYLAESGTLAVEGGVDAIVDRARNDEGARFDRRLAVYRQLRERGVVPKTGLKFGTDFRTYASLDTVEDLGHSELLVRVLSADRVFAPSDLALDVRLAHGVRKRMVFALVDSEFERADERGGATDAEIRWLSVSRLTP